MIKIAVAATGETLSSKIPDLFRDATHLLLTDGEESTLLQVFSAKEDSEGMDKSLSFAHKTVEWDCEALLCGEIEAEPFSILAEKNSVTRYMAAGLSAEEAIQKMNQYKLYFLDEHI